MIKLKIKDRLLLASVSGGLAAAIADLFLYILNNFIPGDNINMPELTAEFFLAVIPGEMDLLTTIMGFIWSLVIGGIYAIIYIKTLDFTGWDKPITKSIIVILGIWILIAGFFMKLLSLSQYVRDEPVSILAFFIAHIFFSIILAIFTKRFAREK